MKCKTNGCDQEVRYKVSGLCSRCYSWKYYWKKKSTADIVRRQQKLSFWLKRMNTIMPANVKMLKKRRKA